MITILGYLPSLGAINLLLGLRIIDKNMKIITLFKTMVVKACINISEYFYNPLQTKVKFLLRKAMNESESYLQLTLF